MRAAASEEDWSAIRALLIELQARAGPGWNWDVRCWDGVAVPPRAAAGRPRLSPHRIAYVSAGRIGPCSSDAAGAASPELDPGMEPRARDGRMGRDASGRPARPRSTRTAGPAGPRRRRATGAAARGARVPAADGRRRLGPDPRARWSPTGRRGHRPGVSPADDDPDDADAVRMAALLNAAFDTTVHTAREYLQAFVERSPSFQHELNLVAEAPDGSFAAHVGLTHEPSNRHGIVEPVCTAPGHRRHGLARALLSEGLVRLAARGVRTVQVETGDDEAPNELYRSCGFNSATRTTSPGTAGRWPDRSPTVRAPARGPRETRSARPGGSARPPRGR